MPSLSNIKTVYKALLRATKQISNLFQKIDKPGGYLFGTAGLLVILSLCFYLN